MHQSDDSSQSEDEGEDSIYLSRGSSAATETADENPLAVSPLFGAQGDSAGWAQLMRCTEAPASATTSAWYQLDAPTSPLERPPVTPPKQIARPVRPAVTPPRRNSDEDALDELSPEVRGEKP